MKLLEVREPLRGGLKARFLTIYGFAEELFCADLLRGCLRYQCLKIEKSDEQDLPGALFLTFGGPREASILH